MLNILIRAVGVIFLVFAAFGWFKIEDVSWFILGLACWCASGLPWDTGLPRRKRAE